MRKLRKNDLETLKRFLKGFPENRPNRLKSLLNLLNLLKSLLIRWPLE
jgi:hypothetical protein